MRQHATIYVFCVQKYIHTKQKSCETTFFLTISLFQKGRKQNFSWKAKTLFIKNARKKIKSKELLTDNKINYYFLENKF